MEAATPNFFYFHLSSRGVTPSHPASVRARVVFLHGWCQSHDCWLKTATRLRDRYGHDSLLMDFYGHGRSPYPSKYSDLTPKLLVAQVRAAIETLGWQHTPVVFAGISLGASVALRYAELYPENVCRFVFLAPSGRKEDSSFNFAVASTYVTNFAVRCAKILENIGLGKSLEFWPVKRMIAQLNLITSTPNYGTKDELDYLQGKRLTVLLGQFDFIHSAQVHKWKLAGGYGIGRYNEDSHVEVKPYEFHASMCYNPDRWRLDLIPEAWHPKENPYFAYRNEQMYIRETAGKKASKPRSPIMSKL